MGHWTGDPQNYRDQQEVAEWKEKCPIKRLKAYMLEKNLADEKTLDAIEKQVAADMEEAVEYASACEYPDPARVAEGIFYEEGDVE